MAEEVCRILIALLFVWMSQASARPNEAGALKFRAAILETIRAEMTRRGIQGGESLRATDLVIQSRVQPVQSEKDLSVRSIRFDPYRSEIGFDIAFTNEPLVPALGVLVRDNRQWIAKVAAELPGSVSSFNLPTAVGGGVAPPSRELRVYLARPGTPAILTLFGENARITMQVLPLQSGVKGQCISVRDAATGQILKAEVSGSNLLQASF